MICRWKKKTGLMMVFSMVLMSALSGCGSTSTDKETVKESVAEEESAEPSDEVASETPEADSQTAENCYLFTYTIENGTDADANGKSEARSSTYVNGTSKNEDYNLLSVGAVGVMGLDGQTALTLHEDGSYLLVKTLTSVKVGVDIEYQFEGIYERNGDAVTLNVPTAGSAIEVIAEGMKSNGINPNYGELTASTADARILNWFATAYISYTEGEAAAMTVKVNDADKSLAFESTAAPVEDSGAENAAVQESSAPEAAAEVMTTFNEKELLLTFYTDHTYAVTVDGMSVNSGSWKIEDHALVTTQISEDKEQDPVVLDSERTMVMIIATQKVPFVLDNAALMAINSVD